MNNPIPHDQRTYCNNHLQVRLLRYRLDGDGFVRTVVILQFLLSSQNPPVLSGYHRVTGNQLYRCVPVGEICSTRIQACESRLVNM